MKKQSDAARSCVTPVSRVPRRSRRQTGQVRSDAHTKPVVPVSPNAAASTTKSDGQPEPDAQKPAAVANAGGLGPSSADDHVEPAGPAELIRQISETWRARSDMHRAEKSLTLQIRAIARRLCRGCFCVGENKCVPLKLCKPCIEQADLLYDEADRMHRALHNPRVKQPTFQHPYLMRYDGAVRPFFDARHVLNKQRLESEKLLEQLAAQLPVAKWIETVRGVSLLSLAAVVAEAGDLSREGHAPWRGYANPAKLWKRMGLALVDGERQRKCADTEKGTAMGYSPLRRSVVWNIGECIIKAGDKHYRAIYDTRKVYEATKIEGPPILIHRRAKRYMEKRFLFDLWRVWNGLPPRGLSETDSSIAA